MSIFVIWTRYYGVAATTVNTELFVERFPMSVCPQTMQAGRLDLLSPQIQVVTFWLINNKLFWKYCKIPIISPTVYKPRGF